MRTPFGVFILIGLMLLLDFYFFQGVKTVMQSASQRSRTIITILYWSVTAIICIGYLLFVFTNVGFLGKNVRAYLFAIIVAMFIAKFVAVAFLLIDDLRRAVQWIAGKLFFKDTLTAVSGEDGISRSAFLSWLSIAAGGTLFSSFIFGFKNKYNYQVRNVPLKFPNLPQAFKGLKIVHISDIHSGSFMDKKAVQHGIDLILAQKPDLILFTGDLVNDKATEMADWKELFSSLKAPLGVFSVLGNHDYGDYVHWPIDGISKEKNLQNLVTLQGDMGWKMLMNENVVLEKEGEKIALIGIGNWSAKARFPKHGKLDVAYAGTEDIPFKMLMSHDPSHWEAEVIPKYGNIDLMLSGHTHGMQFGVEIPGFRWSPVQYIYKQWAGLYENGKQKLYVNRGFGFIGYPGRVGIMPEITVIELV